MYEKNSCSERATLIFADRDGLFRQGSIEAAGKSHPGHLFYWCNCMGEIPRDRFEASASSTTDGGTTLKLPPDILDLYERFQMETAGVHRNVVTFCDDGDIPRSGMLLSVLLDGDWVLELGIPSMEQAFDYLKVTAEAVADKIGYKECLVIAAKNADPDGHELMLFIPGTLLGPASSAYLDFCVDVMEDSYNIMDRSVRTSHAPVSVFATAEGTPHVSLCLSAIYDKLISIAGRHCESNASEILPIIAKLSTIIEFYRTQRHIYSITTGVPSEPITITFGLKKDGVDEFRTAVPSLSGYQIMKLEVSPRSDGRLKVTLYRYHGN